MNGFEDYKKKRGLIHINAMKDRNGLKKTDDFTPKNWKMNYLKHLNT